MIQPRNIFVGLILSVPVFYGGNDAAVWLGATVVFTVWSLLVRTEFEVLHVMGLGFVAAVIVASLLETSRSIALTVSLVGALRMAGYVAAFALAYAYSRRLRDARVMSDVVFWGIVAHAIWALACLSILNDTLLMGPKEAYRGFATGTFVNRSSFATLLGIGLILGAVRASPARLVSCAVIVVTLILTGSRAGVVCALLGVLTVLVLTGTGWRRLVIAGAGLAVAVLTVGAVLLDRMLVAPVDAGDRIALYRNTLSIIAMRPWTGFGLDSFPLLISQFRAPDLGVDLVWDRAHNTLLAHWVELGLILGSVPLVMVTVAAQRLWTGLRQRPQAAPALAILVATMAHAMLDFGLEMAGNVYVLLVVIAIGLPRAAGRTVRNEHAG